MILESDTEQQILFVTTDDGRDLAIPYEAVASWKALLGLGSYDDALEIIIEHTHPDAEPVDWAAKYDQLRDANDTDDATVEQQAAVPAMALRAAAAHAPSQLDPIHDALAALETAFVTQVKQGGKQ